MATISPDPFPEEGKRALTPKENLQRAKAVACTVPSPHKPSCSGQVFVGLFFDGTGNNMKIDYEQRPPDKRKHTNVVKLFQAYRDQPLDGYFRYYMPGVGTPFPEIGDDNTYLFNKNRGAIGSERGEDRIIWAFTRLINSPYRYVFPGTQLISDELSRTISNTLASSTNPGFSRRLALSTWQDKLKAALEGKKPRVEQINLSVFGFSRGAAEARAFVNWLFESCQAQGGGWTFAGIPIRVQFLGIFDTVASVGLANLFDGGTLAGHQSWADNNLQIHPAVERCVHYVAGHEVRACFPLDSVRVKKSYPANAMEVMYPGGHSDVGGGYAPGDLGVSPTPESFMAILPGVSMFHEARKAGVPLSPFERLDKQFQDALTPAPSTIQDFNGYLRDAKIGAGPVEDMHRRHMRLYFSYRFKYRESFFNRPPYSTASAKDQGYLQATQNNLLERLTSMGHGDASDPDFNPRQASALHQQMLKAAGLTLTDKEKHLCQIAEAIDPQALTPGIEALAERHIHDSEAGFIGFGMNEYAINGIGIAKFRTVFKGDD